MENLIFLNFLSSSSELLLNMFRILEIYVIFQNISLTIEGNGHLLVEQQLGRQLVQTKRMPNIKVPLITFAIFLCSKFACRAVALIVLFACLIGILGVFRFFSSRFDREDLRKITVGCCKSVT